MYVIINVHNIMTTQGGGVEFEGNRKNQLVYEERNTIKYNDDAPIIMRNRGFLSIPYCDSLTTEQFWYCDIYKSFKKSFLCERKIDFFLVLSISIYVQKILSNF